MNFFFYMFIILIALCIKMIGQYGAFEWLLYILKPVKSVVEMFLGVCFEYCEGIGFVNNDLKVNIGRGCSGINFFIMVFLMISFSFIPKIKNIKKLPTILICLIASFFITIIANSSRIIGVIFIMNSLLLDIRYERLMHQSIGVVFYFTYLITIYYLSTKFFRKGDEINE